METISINGIDYIKAEYGYGYGDGNGNGNGYGNGSDAVVSRWDE